MAPPNIPPSQPPDSKPKQGSRPSSQSSFYKSLESIGSNQQHQQATTTATPADQEKSNDSDVDNFEVYVTELKSKYSEIVAKTVVDDVVKTTKKAAALKLSRPPPSPAKWALDIRNFDVSDDDYDDNYEYDWVYETDETEETTKPEKEEDDTKDANEFDDSTNQGENYQYCALANNDSTCYAISCLQVLYNATKLRKYLIESQDKGPFHLAMGSLFARMEEQSDRTPPEKDYPVISADRFLEQFRTAKPNFVAGEQHDAHEFLGSLIELLHQEANGAKPPSATATRYQPKSAEEAWNYHVTHIDDSFLSQILLGQVESTLTCLVCVRQSRSWSSIWQLQLQIESPGTTDSEDRKPNENHGITLLNCIEEFTTEEILQDDSAPFCDLCCGRKIASKKQLVCRAPKGLIIHLKRFTANGGKINRPVEIAPELMVCANRLILHSGIIHRGTETTDGHYRALFRAGANEWVLFDDDNVIDGLHDRKAMSLLRKYAYLVFYYQEGEEGEASQDEPIELTITDPKSNKANVNTEIQ